MAIMVTGSNPTRVTVVSHTITTDTAFTTSPSNDRIFTFADSIVGTIDTDVMVGGFGLQLQTTALGGGITMTNNGSIIVDQLSPALDMIGRGGQVIYDGTGFITNHGSGPALNMSNDGAGSIIATIRDDIAADDAIAIAARTDGSGLISFAQAAGTTISNRLTGALTDVVSMLTSGGPIVATLNGRIIGDGGVQLSSFGGNITVNFGGSINTAFEDAISTSTMGAITINSFGNIVGKRALVASGFAGDVVINVTGGVIRTYGGTGDDAIVAETATGDIDVNMTGGQIGTATQRVNVGIFAATSYSAFNSSGNCDVVATDIFSVGDCISASVDDTSTGATINVTVNGVINSLSGNGISTVNIGPGSTTVTINAGASVIGSIFGVFSGNSADTVNNNGTITGTAGPAVNLREGNDAYNGANGALNGEVLGGNGNDTLTSGAGNNTLRGQNNDDILNGGAGTDTMDGGAGNDFFTVDNAGDVIIEGAGQGTNDRARTSVTYTLGSGVEVELLSTLGSGTTTVIHLGGNELANILQGNAANNILNGNGGADTLHGFAGNDSFFVDVMGDTIVEAAGQGTDIASVSASYTLGVDVSVETLQTTNAAATTAINLTGNNLVNTVIGNAGGNILNGGGDADTLQGLGGNDAYTVDNTADIVVEAAGQGTDNVNTSTSYTLAAGVSAETLRTVDPLATTVIHLNGNEINNFVTGNAAYNQLDGRLGNDTLTGNAGNDFFLFSTALNAATNVDTIVGFSVADDTIRLKASIFTGLPAGGVLNADAFHIGVTAADAEDRIMYNSGTGALSFDADGTGSGGAIKFAQLTAGLSLTNADFIVV